MPFRNISMSFLRNWTRGAHWTKEGKCEQTRRYETSCEILFKNGLEAGLHIFVSDIQELQNATDKKPLYQ